MKFPSQKLVGVNQLKQARYNPKLRASREQVRALADSISRLGLIYPVVVDDKNNLIDGHRRLSAVKLLGWSEIPAIVMQGDRDKIYAGVNSTAKKMGGNDALGVWLTEPTAVAPNVAKALGQMESAIGRKMCEKIYKAGLSMRVYRTALRICRYCDDTTVETITAVLNWLLKFAVIGQVMKALESGESPKLIMRAVKSMKPIRFKLSLAA